MKIKEIKSLIRLAINESLDEMARTAKKLIIIDKAKLEKVAKVKAGSRIADIINYVLTTIDTDESGEPITTTIQDKEGNDITGLSTSATEKEAAIEAGIPGGRQQGVNNLFRELRNVGIIAFGQTVVPLKNKPSNKGGERGRPSKIKIVDLDDQELLGYLKKKIKSDNPVKPLALEEFKKRFGEEEANALEMVIDNALGGDKAQVDQFFAELGLEAKKRGRKAQPSIDQIVNNDKLPEPPKMD